jgi:hypothetical protein
MHTVPPTPDDSVLSPFQAGLRFAIELTALVCWGAIGWQLGSGATRWLTSIGLILAAAIVWGTFRAPDDHSANGDAPVPVPGIVRLLIELDLLLGAAIVSAVLWRPFVGIVLGVAVVAHYAATTRRVRWLLAQRTTGGTSGRN